MEADVNQITESMIQKYGTLPPGKSLDKLLSQPAWDKLSRTLSNIDAKKLAKLRPWIVESVYLNRVSPLPGHALDIALLAKAKGTGKKVEYLEFPVDQFKAFQKAEDLQFDKVIKELEKSIQNPELRVRETKKLVAAYLKGDTKGVKELVFQQVKQSPKAYHAMFTERNKKWLSKIEKYIQRDRVFIAVGVGHLIGPSNLVAMLEEKGYSLKRLSGPFPKTSSLAWKKIQQRGFRFLIPKHFTPLQVLPFQVFPLQLGDLGQNVWIALSQDNSPEKPSLEEVANSFFIGLKSSLPTAKVVQKKTIQVAKKKAFFLLIEGSRAKTKLYFYCVIFYHNSKLNMWVCFCSGEKWPKYRKVWEKIFQSMKFVTK